MKNLYKIQAPNFWSSCLLPGATFHTISLNKKKKCTAKASFYQMNKQYVINQNHQSNTTKSKNNNAQLTHTQISGQQQVRTVIHTHTHSLSLFHRERSGREAIMTKGEGGKNLLPFLQYVTKL